MIINRNITFKSSQRDDWNKASNHWAKAKSSGGSVFQKEVITKEVLRAVGDVKDKKVLDLGCGEGLYSRLLAQKGANVTGVDISDEQITKAKIKNDELINNPKYICSSSSKLDQIEDDSFDKVVSIMHTMYLDKQEFNNTLKEAHRVLKPDGELIIITRHPFTTRPTNKDESQKKEFASSYFSEKSFKHTMKLDDKKIDVHYHPRTLSKFFNELVDEGFTIKRVNEPKPSSELVLAYNNLERFAYNPALITIQATEEH